MSLPAEILDIPVDGRDDDHLDDNCTVQAGHVFRITEMLELQFATHTVGTQVVRRLQITGLDAPSTDGGRKARQAIMLADVHEQKPAIVIGFLDAPHRAAQLKSYVVISQEYSARYGVPIDIAVPEYDRFVKALIAFLKGQQIDARLANVSAARVATRTRAPAVMPRPTMGHATIVLVASTACLVGFALGLVVGVTL